MLGAQVINKFALLMKNLNFWFHGSLISLERIRNPFLEHLLPFINLNPYIVEYLVNGTSLRSSVPFKLIQVGFDSQNLMLKLRFILLSLLSLLLDENALLLRSRGDWNNFMVFMILSEDAIHT
jgi:hypothetical protein